MKRKSYVGSRLRRYILAILSVAGVAVSAYLTFEHYQLVPSVCLFHMKCDKVLASPYAQLWGVPIALIGLGMYALISLMVFASWRNPRWEHVIGLGIYGVSLSGIVFTGYLYYVEIFILKALCTWCMVSSVVLMSIFVVSVLDFVITGKKLTEMPAARRFRISDYVTW